MRNQPWIHSPSVDSFFILLPPFFCLLLITIFPSWFQSEQGLPDFAWIVLILLIDVAHVYSTLFRTYFDPIAFKRQKGILVTIPFVGFIIGALTYSISPLYFWRILAYVAVFHFIRQQYGFMRVYSRKEKKNKSGQRIDSLMIYAATIYPILVWHLRGPQAFNWFIENDFLYVSIPYLKPVLTIVYITLSLLFYIKEWYVWRKEAIINLPKLLIVAGTQLSWYFGIVYFNGDLTFTLLNVVSHGIPYMALVWVYGKKHYNKPDSGSSFLRLVFSKYGWVIFLLCLFIFAFAEEGLWDWGVWQEHGNLFGWRKMSQPILSDRALSIIVPLLALPQITHYILDGFIWKVKQDDFQWSNEKKTTSSGIK